MLMTYDSAADAAYIYLVEEPEVSRSIMINENLVVDLDPQGTAVGIEILAASAGFALEDVITRFKLTDHAAELRQAAREFRPAATA